MTSPLANNSKAASKRLFGFKEYLEVEPGTQIPIEGQIPQTYEVLNTVSGTFTDLLNGSNNEIINADLTAGNVIYTFSLAGLRNLFGRTMNVSVLPTNHGGVRTVAINLPLNCLYIYQGAAVPLVTRSLVFPVGVASSVQLSFTQSGHAIVTGELAGYVFA